MIDRADFKIAGLAMAFGWGAKEGIILVSHWAAKLGLQLLTTLAIGLITLTVQHFYRQFLERNFPEGQAPGFLKFAAQILVHLLRRLWRRPSTDETPKL